jgi:hypothetical protein
MIVNSGWRRQIDENLMDLQFWNKQPENKVS